MKKRLSLLIALVLTAVMVLPLITACDKDKTVTNIDFVDPKKDYRVGETIEYDDLEVKITYDDGSQDTKTVAELTKNGATLHKADLSKAGNTYYSLSYKGAIARVNIVVSASSDTPVVTYTVTFKYNDNKTSDTTEQVEANGVLGDKLPTPEREGYTFVGWFTDIDGNTKWDKTTHVQGNTTLYARWQQNVTEKVTVTYMLNDGESSEPYFTKEINKDTAIDSHPAAPVRDGFTFVGWFTEAENGSEWDIEALVEEDLTLYAHWTEGGGAQTTQFTVTLKYCDGTTSDGSVVVNEGEALGDKLPSAPVWAEHTFLGWYTAESEGGDKWESATPVTANLTLFARWQEIVRKQYTVTFVFHDNKTADLKVEIYENSAIGNAWPQDPVWKDHEFLGWFTQEQGGDERDREFIVTSDVTLHAQWETLVQPPEIIAFEFNQGYSDYVAKSTRADDVEEGRADFRVTGLPYEVGNVNGFSFVPRVTASIDGKIETILDPEVNAKVYAKDTKESDYVELKGAELENIVTKTGNNYKFTEQAADKYIRLELSLDPSAYDLEALAKKTLTVDFVVVDNAYNVYDQTGLSVMADLEKRAWSEIWGCDTRINGNNVELIPNADSKRFPWDDDYLCNYVDKIDWVILHNSIELDPDDMPSLYFWTSDEGKETSVLYKEAYDSLAHGGTAAAPFADKLVGTLRDGANLSADSSENIYGDANYCRVMDVKRVEYSGIEIQGQHGVETNIELNMAKGLFTTKRVSVSGNYQTVSYTKHDPDTERTEHGRLLVTYCDYSGTAVTDPVSHWSVFQMIQSRVPGAEQRKFAIKNVGFDGNNGVNEVGSSDFHYAGLMMSSSYTSDISYSNTYASNFYVNVVQDNYGDFTFVNEKFDENGPAQNSVVSIENSKFYYAYSNMTFMWRGHIIVKNSEMIGSGGPIFIMCDASNSDHVGATSAVTPNQEDNPKEQIEGYGKTDVGGPQLEMDAKSVFQAYATGSESWYGIYHAEPLFTLIKSELDGKLLRQQLGKTVTFSNEKGDGYVNVIAVIIPDAENIFNGKKFENASEKLDVRGVVTQRDDDDNEINKFAMHNNFIMTARRFASGNAAKYPIYMESGKAALIYDSNATGRGALWNNSQVELSYYFMLPTQTVPAYYAMQGMLAMVQNETTQQKIAEYQEKATFGVADLLAWRQETSELACLYLSAGALPGSNAPDAPYFGVVLQIGDYTPTEG